MAPMIIAVAGRKGGVGKTTITCGLASVFASQNYKVLVIDLDPQSNVAFALGADPVAPGTAQLILGKKPSLLSIEQNLDILPGGVELTNQAIQMAHPEDLADAIVGFDHDVVIFDCPPGNDHLERMALIAAHVALVVANAHPLAILGAGRVLNELKQYREKGRKVATRWAIVQSQLDKRRKLDKSLEAVLNEHFAGIPYLTVHQDTDLANTTASQQLLMTYAPESRGAQDLQIVGKWCLHG